MPNQWSSKDERQYEHIKRSELDRGRRESRAKEIAARSVNMQRRQEGRTPNRRTQGTGNPKTPLPDRSRDELYNLAKQQDVKGRSNMSKSELVDALRS